MTWKVAAADWLDREDYGIDGSGRQRCRALIGREVEVRRRKAACSARQGKARELRAGEAAERAVRTAEAPVSPPAMMSNRGRADD
jgi:hypothetical protein